MFEILSKLFLSVIAANIYLLSSHPNCSSALIYLFARNPLNYSMFKEVPTECNGLNKYSIYWNAISVIES